MLVELGLDHELSDRYFLSRIRLLPGSCLMLSGQVTYSLTRHTMAQFIVSGVDYDN